MTAPRSFTVARCEPCITLLMLPEETWLTSSYVDVMRANAPSVVLTNARGNAHVNPSPRHRSCRRAETRAHASSSSSKKDSADVVVIGGGLSGLAASSLPDQRDGHPLGTAAVRLAIADLLPGTEVEPTLGDRYHHRPPRRALARRQTCRCRPGVHRLLF